MRASPSTTSWKRRAEAIDDTAASACPLRCSSGPCSMWASRYATSSSGRRAASPTRPGRDRTRGTPRATWCRRRRRGPTTRGPTARDGRRPQQGLAEARALLVAEGDHLERERKGAGCRTLVVDETEQPDDLERHQHPDDPVEASGVGDGVQVRPEQQGGGVGGARGSESSDLVARGILTGRHAELAHPLRREAVDPRVLGREVDAGDAPRRRGDPREFFAPPHDAAGGGRDALGSRLQAGRGGHRRAPAAASREAEEERGLTPPPPRTRPARPRPRRRRRPSPRDGAAPSRGRRAW